MDVNRFLLNMSEGYFRSVVANVHDCDIVVSGFELQTRYYVNFQINTHRKGRNTHIPPVLDF